MKKIYLLFVFLLLNFSLNCMAEQKAVQWQHISATVNAETFIGGDYLEFRKENGHPFPFLNAEGDVYGDIRFNKDSWLFSYEADEIVINTVEHFVYLKNGFLQLPKEMKSSQPEDQSILNEIEAAGLDASKYTKGALSCKDGLIQGIFGMTPAKLSFCDGKNGVTVSCDGDNLEMEYTPYAKYCMHL